MSTFEREFFSNPSLDNPSVDTSATPDKLEGKITSEILTATTPAEYGTMFKEQADEAILTTTELCNPTDSKFTALTISLAEREKEFKNTTDNSVDMVKVDKYLETVYGADSTRETLNNKIDHVVGVGLDITGFSKLLDMGRGRHPRVEKEILTNAIKLALATASPNEANSLLKSLEANTLKLETSANNLTTNAKLVLGAVHALENNKYTPAAVHGGTPGAPVSPKLKPEVKDYLEHPRDVAKKATFQAFVVANGLTTDPIMKVNTGPKGIAVEEWTCKTVDGKKEPASKLFKGIFNPTAGALVSMAPSMRKVVDTEVSSFNKKSFSMLSSQLNTISELATIAKGTDPLNKKLTDLAVKLHKPETKEHLGDLFDTVDANVSIENPKHKEVLARRSLEVLNLIVAQKNLNLTELKTPWNTTWSDEFNKAAKELNDNRNVLTVAELLGRVAVFGNRELKAQAEIELRTVMTSWLLTEGSNKADVIKGLMTLAPADYGTGMKKLFTDTGAGNLGADMENKSVKMAALIFKRLESIHYYKDLTSKAPATLTAEEKEKLGFLTNRLFNTEGSIFDINKAIDPSKFSDRATTELGDPLKQELQKNAIAEVLGLNATDPKVSQILGLTTPGNVLELENTQLNKINRSENIRKAGLAGISAVGVALAFTPGLNAVGVGIMAVTGIAKIGLTVKNIVESSRRIGFKETMKNMWQGIKQSFTYLFDKEHTTKEKLVYGAAFLGGAGRMFLPGLGSAIYAVAETGAAIGAEVQLKSQRQKVALEIAALRSTLENTNYQTTGHRTVNTVDVWNEYKKRREDLLEEKRREAVQTGNTPKPLDNYSDETVLATIKANKYHADANPDKEKDFLEVMQVIVDKQKTIHEMNEKYAKTSGMWGAAFAGTMAGSLLGGIAKLGVNIAASAHTAASTNTNASTNSTATSNGDSRQLGNSTTANSSGDSRQLGNSTTNSGNVDTRQLGSSEIRSTTNTGSGILVKNGSVDLKDSAWNGQPAQGAIQGKPEDYLNPNNSTYGLYGVTADELEKDLEASGITRTQLDTLTTTGIHHLLNNYASTISAGQNPTLVDEISKLGTPEAIALANTLGK